MDKAAAKGHHEVLKWIRENRFDGCSKNAMDDAARNGHLEVEKWLHINTTAGCTTRAMDLAALKGHLQVCKWLYANRSEGCTPDRQRPPARGGLAALVEALSFQQIPGAKPTVALSSQRVRRGALPVSSSLLSSVEAPRATWRTGTTDKATCWRSSGWTRNTPERPLNEAKESCGRSCK